MPPKTVPKKRKSEDEGRVFKEIRGIQYFVIENNNHTISCLICSKQYSDGDFIKECLVSSAEILCPKQVSSFKNISLSRNTISTRIRDMAGDLREQLKADSSKYYAYSLALDESTDRSSIAQLAIFIRGCTLDLNVTEELLELIPMHGHTTSLDIYEKLVAVLLQYDLPFKKIVGLATDGAPAMVGVDNGVGKRLFSEILQSNPNASFIHIHCIIHQEVLCGKALKFDNVLKIVTKIVNFIRARGLNHRQFTEFLKEIQSEFVGIPYYTHVRWLSCHAVLKRFYELLEEIATFLEIKEKVFAEIHNDIWVQDLAFCTDITGHLAELKIAGQGSTQIQM